MRQLAFIIIFALGAFGVTYLFAEDAFWLGLLEILVTATGLCWLFRSTPGYKPCASCQNSVPMFESNKWPCYRCAHSPRLGDYYLRRSSR